MRTKKIIIALAMLFGLLAKQEQANAQIPVVSLISSAIKKVITALDLKVQQLQNQTITLQNAEQNVENGLHLSSLTDIGSWLNKERSLYADYYKELATVKTIISDYDEVKHIISQQEELVAEYNNANTLFHRDSHFSASELNQMVNIYTGILQESIRNLDEVLLAVNSFSTQMSDFERLGLIHKASAGMQTNLDHLRQFNNQNALLSLERARDENDRRSIKTLYGIAP